MAQYARRVCFECGLMLPQPEMQAVEVQRIGASGRVLSTRDKWMCPSCWEAYCQVHFSHERRVTRQLAEDDAKTREGKKRWAEEQERRRLANMDKRLQSESE